MLCSPLNASATKLGASDTNVVGSHKIATNGIKHNFSSSNNNLNHTNNHGNQFNNNNFRQPNYENGMIAASTIREIKSRNIGSLSPLCPSNVNSTAQFIIERRQAISMDRLNSIHQQDQSIHNRSRLGSKDNGGSLSSGGSNESLDDCNYEPPTKARGLTRSASRVSRFRSAKEFFERLSSVKNCAPTRMDKPPLPERPRGSVVTRYTSSVKAASQVNLSSVAPASMVPVQSIVTDVTSSSTNTSASSASEPVSTLAPASIPRPTIPPASAKPASAPTQPLTSATIDPSNVMNATKPIPMATPSNATSKTTSPSPSRSRLQPPAFSIAPFGSSSRPVIDLKINYSRPSLLADCSNGSSEGPQSPNSALADVLMTFEGDNVIVNNGSLLNRRNKQLKIQFDESSTLTYEYPSEEVMMAESESSSPPPSLTSSEIPAPSEQKTSGTHTDETVGSLSTYKPSALMVEIPDDNIDDKLGVKKLTGQSRFQTPAVQGPAAQASMFRANVDHERWASNNGSIIYAQSNLVKNGLTNGCHQGSATTGKPSASVVSSINGIRSRQSNVADSPRDTNSQSKCPTHEPSDEAQSKASQANAPSAPSIKRLQDSGNLDQVNPNKWSNGFSATSDLLF